MHTQAHDHMFHQGMHLSTRSVDLILGHHGTTGTCFMKKKQKKRKNIPTSTPSQGVLEGKSAILPVLTIVHISIATDKVLFSSKKS